MNASSVVNSPPTVYPPQACTMYDVHTLSCMYMNICVSYSYSYYIISYLYITYMYDIYIPSHTHVHVPRYHVVNTHTHTHTYKTLRAIACIMCYVLCSTSPLLVSMCICICTQHTCWDIAITKCVHQLYLYLYLRNPKRSILHPPLWYIYCIILYFLRKSTVHAMSPPPEVEFDFESTPGSLDPGWKTYTYRYTYTYYSFSHLYLYLSMFCLSH